MTEEITKPLDHAQLIRHCERVVARLSVNKDDYSIATADLFRAAGATFQSIVDQGTAQDALPLLKAKVEVLRAQDEETMQALTRAFELALADELHGPDKVARLKPARKARDAARRALHESISGVTAGERAIVSAMMHSSMSAQTLMSSCLHWALFVFGTTTDKFPASLDALKVFIRSGVTADVLKQAAKRISDFHAAESVLGNITPLQPRTRTAEEVKSNAMSVFLSVFLPEIAQSESFAVLHEEEGAPLLSYLAEPLVQAFRWHAENELRSTQKRAAAG